MPIIDDYPAIARALNRQPADTLNPAPEKAAGEALLAQCPSCGSHVWCGWTCAFRHRMKRTYYP